jgi:tetratricopeptide (TPR) repeat protein
LTSIFIPKSELSSKQWNQKGEELLAAGRHQEAIECFDKSIRLYHDFADAWRNMGYGFDISKRYNEAANCFDKAIKLYKSSENHDKNDSKIVDALYKQGLSLSKANRFEESIKCFDKAIEIEPDFADAWHYKGYALGNLKKYDESIKCFDKAIEIEPDFADAWRNMGFAYSKLDIFDKAIECFDKAIEINPRFVYAWNSKGFYLINYKEKYDYKIDNKEIVECFDKAIETDPNFAYAWLNKGYMLYSTKDYDKAIECFDKATSIDAINYYAWDYKGHVHIALKRYDDARRDFEKVMEIAPAEYRAEAWNNKGISIIYSTKDYDKAIECFDKAIGLRPYDFPESLHNKGYSLYCKGAYQKAIECFDKAIECFDKSKTIKIDSVYAWYNKGSSLGNLEKYGEAIECFDKAIEIGYDWEKSKGKRESGEKDLDLRRNLADLYRKKGFAIAKIEEDKDKSKAKECFDKSIEIYRSIRYQDKDKDIDTDLAYALNSRGYFFILYELERYYEEGMKSFNEAIEILPNSFAYPYYNAGHLLIKKGKGDRTKYTEAIKYLNKAIRIDPEFGHAWYDLGYVLCNLEKCNESIKCFDKAIEIFYKHIKGPEDSNYPHIVNVWQDKGKALDHLGRHKDALECFDNAIYEYETIKTFDKTKIKNLNKDIVNVWLHKGNVLNSLKDYDRAIECFDKAIEINPEIVEAWCSKGHALYNLAEFEESRECFDKAIEKKQQYSKDDKENNLIFLSFLMRGQANYFLGNYKSALDDFGSIKDMDYEKGAVLIGEKHNSVGLCYHKQQLFKQAEQEYLKAVKTSSNKVKAVSYYNLGVLYIDEKKKDAAKKMFEKCLENDQSFSKATDALSKLEKLEQSDWYEWWFNHGHSKGKRTIGILLMASILSPLIIVAIIIGHTYVILGFNDEILKLDNFIDHHIEIITTTLLTIIGLSIAILLIPSLTKVKVGSIVELQTNPIHTNNNDIKLETYSDTPILKIENMPYEIPLESFRMPLQSFRLQSKFLFKSVRMSLPYWSRSYN